MFPQALRDNILPCTDIRHVPLVSHKRHNTRYVADVTHVSYEQQETLHERRGLLFPTRSDKRLYICGGNSCFPHSSKEDTSFLRQAVGDATVEAPVSVTILLIVGTALQFRKEASSCFPRIITRVDSCFP